MKKSNWLTFLINGLVALAIGLFLLLLNGDQLKNFVKIFGGVVLLAGLVLLILAIRNIRLKQSYAILLSEALAGLIIGAVILINPRGTMQVVGILLGIWAIAIGVIQIVISAREKEALRTKQLVQVNGLLTALLGILMMFNPFETFMVLKVIVGILAAGVGLLMIYFSLASRASSRG